ncbi:MAG: hypothetical protein MI922_06980 [Bacteroidales bacterium]|nr:hypothetical protein [Bacteroidales bacterium]
MGTGNGAGSILHMVNTLKNNRPLLKRRSKFKNSKEYFDAYSDASLGAEGELHIKPITEEELQSVRQKTIASNRTWLLVMVVASLLIGIPITFFMTRYFIKARHDNLAYMKQKQELVIEQERLAKEELINKFQNYIVSGGEWLNKKHFYNAAFQYRKAYELNVDNDEATKRLFLTYTQECFNENKQCELAIQTIHQYLQTHPEEKNLAEKMEMCKDVLNDIERSIRAGK